MSGTQFANINPLNILLAFLFMLSACGEGGKEKDEKEKKDEEKELQKEKSSQEKEGMNKSPVLPSTLQVANSFKRAGLPYEEGLTLSPEDAERFMNHGRKNLAFGAYSADLAYLVLNEEYDQAQGVMEVLMGLSEDLGISNVFDIEGIADRFRSNLDNKDSLVNLIMEVQQKFDTYVAKNRSSDLRIIAYAGGWTEAIHLAANTEIEDEKQLRSKVEEQMRILNKLLKAMKLHVDSEEGAVGELQKELKAMNDTYQGAKPSEGETIPDPLMKKLKEHADKARKIISNPGS